ncbi:MAG TPA: aldehyde dehydrogenase family protein, partial [Bacteroidota bacterium]|nr:aldehyde dehydrogenase family protein [Bacteroidota bacterium]
MIPFSNQTYIDFSNPDNVKKQLDAISKVESKLGREYPNIIGGKEIFSEKKTKSINPANPDQVVGIFQKSGADQAELAINTAYETFKWWRNFPPVERAEFLFKAAEYVRKHRYEINAWMIKEVGKNYAEADGDVSEGIDFFEYYGREMLRYMR